MDQNTDSVSAELLAELNQIAAGERQRMPERVFKGVFLPLFAGTGNPYNVTYLHWANMANGPYNEVDVIDAAGKLIFTVPALLRRDAVHSAAEGLLPLRGIFQKAFALSSIHPAQAKEYMSKQFETHLRSTVEQPDTSPEDKVWLSIFERYGIVPANGTESAAVGEKTNDEPPMDFLLA